MRLPQGWELLVILGLVVLLFGAKRLPDAARGVGRSLRILKAETKGLAEDGAENGAKDGAKDGAKTDAPAAPPQSLPSAQTPADAPVADTSPDPVRTERADG